MGFVAYLALWYWGDLLGILGVLWRLKSWPTWKPRWFEGQPSSPHSNAPSNDLWLNCVIVFCWPVLVRLGPFEAMGYADKYAISSYQPDFQVVMA